MNPHRLLSVALAALLASAAALSAQGRVFLYPHSDYQGQPIILTAGQRLSNFDGKRFPDGSRANDAVSSIRIEGAVSLQIFGDANYSGPRLTVTQNLPNLADHRSGRFRWNDRISSVITSATAAAAPPTRAYAILYEDDNYQGRAVTVYAGQREVQLDPNDAVSSVRVFGGATVTLYEHREFQGGAIVVFSDTPSLRPFAPQFGEEGFNDRASSAEVYAAPPPPPAAQPPGAKPRPR